MVTGKKITRLNKIILFYFIFLFSGLTTVSFAQDPGDRPNVVYVRMGIETKKNISVKDFDSAFSNNEYKVWEAQTEEEADSLDIYFKQFVRIRNQEVNIRVKIEYFIRGNSILIYMSSNGVFTEGFYYFKNENLFHFLQGKLKD